MAQLNTFRSHSFNADTFAAGTFRSYTITPPDAVGIPFCQRRNELHFIVPRGRMHWTATPGRIHLTMPGDN